MRLLDTNILSQLTKTRPDPKGVDELRPVLPSRTGSPRLGHA